MNLYRERLLGYWLLVMFIRAPAPAVCLGLSEAGLDKRDLAAAAALASTVELAIDENVSTVVFAGDIVESTNARFEVIRSLEHEVTRLVQAGISVYGVSVCGRVSSGNTH